MSMSLKMAMYNIWKPDYERRGISSVFKPVFTRYIGVEDQSEYPNILLTLKKKTEERKDAVMFDGQVPMQAEFEIITYVGNELATMDVTNLKVQDITLFDDAARNTVFLNALDQVVNLALEQETFRNDSVRNDFILKLIVWTYSYIRPMQFDNSYSPKCIYFGDITRHEVYFLMMLHLMAFDVLYINPLRENNWEVETLGISEQHKNLQIIPIKPLDQMTAGAHVIEQEESMTLQYEQQVADEILAGTGTFRSWQFRDGNTLPLFIKASQYDLTANWKEPSRVRDGFKVQEKVVTVSNLFFQIDGVPTDLSEYAKLVEMCTTQPNTFVSRDCGRGFLDWNMHIQNEDKLKLAFCVLSDGTYDINEIKALPFYQWDKYRDSLEDAILSKINNLFSDGLFKKKLSQTEQFNIICDILSMNQTIIKMADGFDYTDKVPKIVIYLDNETSIEDRMLYLLGFIWELGFDIAVFNPAGLFSIDSVFDPSRFNLIRFEEMKYDMTLEKAKKKQKTGFIGRLFG